MSDHASVLGRFRRRWRPTHAGYLSIAVVVGTIVLNLIQQPGLTTFDTKLDLQVDPAGFLHRSLSLWNGDSAVGGLQNQASGYLFPMGPVFLLGHALGVPMWVWERLWSAAVMLLAYAGTRRLALQWPGINAMGAVFAGLSYMLAPRILTTVGGLSGETLPAAIVPWTLLPLVMYLQGTMGRWVAVLTSAATIPLMGGQNATLVVACLVLPGLLLLLESGRSVGRRLVDSVAWTGLAIVASLWWLLPLVLLGQYAPPFLDFIEAATHTAGNIGWVSALRGTNHWVAFFPGGGSSGWTGGYALASSSLVLFTSLMVAGIGLIGLVRRDLWARRTLLGAVLIGVIVLSLGHGGLAGSLLSASWLGALDSWLSPFRNVHKFDPLVRLPLSLGLGAVITLAPALVVRCNRVQRPWRRPTTVAALAVVGLMVGAAAVPAAGGELRNKGGWDTISKPWRDATDYLNSRPGEVRVLVLPAAGFAIQDWGRTIDEPIQVLGGPPWVARAQVTVAPAGTLRMMDSIEAALGEGRPAPSLVPTLRRLGITHVLVRNDLDHNDSDAPAREQVAATIAGSPELRSVGEWGLQETDVPAIEAFEVAPSSAEPRVSLTPWSQRRSVQGGQEVIGALEATGLLEQGQPAIIGDQQEGLAPQVLTDSNRRVERSFGRVHEAVSGVMTRTDRFREHRPAHDYVGEDVPRQQTTAEYIGVESVTASSSGGYGDVVGPVRPEEHPYAALDRSVFTAWTSAPFTTPEGEWVELGFDGSVDPGSVDIAFDHARGVDVARVRLRTDSGSKVVQIRSDGSATDVDLPPGPTRKVRLTILEASSDQGQVMLTNFGFRDRPVSRTLRVPGNVGETSAVHVQSEPPRRACLPLSGRVECRQSWQRESTETVGFTRTINVVEEGRWRLSGSAVATHGRALENLLAPLSPRQVRVEASSTYAGDPAVAPANAYDGRVHTGWTSSPLDPTPGLRLSWKGKRSITSVRALLSQGQPGVLPRALVVDPLIRGVKPQLVDTSGPRAGVVRPMRTDQLRIAALPDPERTEGVGISELSIAGLDDLRYTPDLDGRTGALCGFGPTVQIAGNTIQTRLAGTVSDVIEGGQLDVEPCGAPAKALSPGSHQITVQNPSGFAVTDLQLTPAEASPKAVSQPSAVQVRSWSPSRRTVSVDSAVTSLLAWPESANPGWTATFDGERLTPVTVDGWKQGWVVPADSSGEVHMEFSPQTTFIRSLIGGGLAALLVMLTAVGAWILTRRRPVAAPAGSEAALMSPRSTILAECGVLVVLAVVSVPLAVGAVAGRVSRRMDAMKMGVVCLGLLGVAATIGLLGSSAIKPLVGAEVLTALVVGIVAGRVGMAPRPSEGRGTT